jgi:Kef-type K+ transport system membrane component KefB
VEPFVLWFAGGGGGGNFLLDICIATVAAALGGMVAQLLRQPVMVGVLLGGIAVGPLGLHFVEDAESIKHISEIGLLFLLFLIGLEIEPHRIFGHGARPTLVALLQVPLCAGAAWVVLSLAAPAMAGLGPLGALVEGGHTRILLAVAVAIPSAEIVTKVLADRHELSTDAGRVTRAALGAKSIYVLIALALLPALPQVHQPEQLWHTAVGAISTVGVAALVGRLVLPLLFQWLWKEPEVVLLLAIAWGFGLAALSDYFHLSLQMGALLAGMALSTHSVGESIAVRLRSLRDFFHALFFVAVGMRLVVPDGAGWAAIGIVLGLVVVTRLVVVAPLVLAARGDRRTAITSTLHLCQLSVLSIELVALAVHEKYIGGPAAGVPELVLVPAYAIAAVCTTYGIGFSPVVARRVERSTTTTMMAPVRQVLLLGFHHNASTLIGLLGLDEHNVKELVHVADWNLGAYKQLTASGIACTYGDLSTLETLERAGARHAQVIVLTLTSEQLLGTTAAHIVSNARRLNPSARIIALAGERSEVKVLRKAGADEVVAPRRAVAKALAPRILGALKGQKPTNDPLFGDEVLP